MNMGMMNILIECNYQKGITMENTENVTIENYLKKIGFEEEDIEYILKYAENEIDSKILHEKWNLRQKSTS